MKEFILIVNHFKKAQASKNKDHICHIVNAWLCHYLETGVNLARK